MRPTIGHWLEPEDAVDPNLNLDAVTHKNSGVCWGEEQMLDQDTGELVDYFHVVRAHAGYLAFHGLVGGRVGTVHPPSPATIDGIIKLAGRHLTEKGRHAEKRVARVVDVLLGVVRNMPQAEAPSIFDPLPGHDNPEEDAGWVIGGHRFESNDTLASPQHPMWAIDDSVPKASGRMMLGKLDTIRALDPLLVNEVRRAARDAALPMLADGVELTLSQTVAYDTILRRWERTAAAHATAANHETREL